MPEATAVAEWELATLEAAVETVMEAVAVTTEVEAMVAATGQSA